MGIAFLTPGRHGVMGCPSRRDAPPSQTMAFTRDVSASRHVMGITGADGDMSRATGGQTLVR